MSNEAMFSQGQSNMNFLYRICPWFSLLLLAVLTVLLFIMADREGVKERVKGVVNGGASSTPRGVAFGEGGTEDLRGTIV